MKDPKSNSESPRRWSVLAVMLMVALATSVVLPSASAQESVDEARKEREEVKADRSNALRELEAAKLKNDELAELLDYLNVEIATTELAVDMLDRELLVVEAELEAARQIKLGAVVETARLKAEIATIAVAGFVRSSHKEEAFFSAGSLSDAYRQDSLIREANAEPAELLDQVRLVEEDGLLAEVAVQEAASETIKLEQQLAAQLEGLEGDLIESAELKEEFERRVAEQEAKVAERQRDIDELTAYIIAKYTGFFYRTGGRSSGGRPLGARIRLAPHRSTLERFRSQSPPDLRHPTYAHRTRHRRSFRGTHICRQGRYGYLRRLARWVRQCGGGGSWGRLQHPVCPSVQDRSTSR